jgi:hypothetical protein
MNKRNLVFRLIVHLTNREALGERGESAFGSRVRASMRFARRNGELEQGRLSGREELKFGIGHYDQRAVSVQPLRQEHLSPTIRALALP